jgi:hypothetical protein
MILVCGPCALPKFGEIASDHTGPTASFQFNRNQGMNDMEDIYSSFNMNILMKLVS